MVDQPLPFAPLPAQEMKANARAFRERMQSRRTVRDFAATPVPREVIEDCLRAAGSAPSGANLQPWHFVAISAPDLKQRIQDGAEAEERAFYGGRAPEPWLAALAPLGTGPEKPFLTVAPWLIAIFAAQSYLAPDGTRQPTYYPKESVGIATGFLLAALHHAGLVSLTHTPSPMNFLNAILGRPAHEKPFLLLVVGYPAEDARVPAIVRKPLAEFTSFRS